MFNPFAFPGIGPVVRPMTGRPTSSPLELFLMLQQQGQLPMGPETIDAQRMRNFSPMQPTPFMPTNLERPMPTPFPQGMNSGIGVAPPMPQEIPQQAPAQWNMPQLPSIRQFMSPQAQMQPQMPAQQEPLAPPSVRQYMQPEQTFNYQSANDALTQGSQVSRGGINPMAMALLAAGLGTLQHAGPSTRKVSLGQALGAGGMRGLDTFAQFRQMQNQEQNDAENTELRREQIGDLRLNRQAQRDKMQADLEERQRLSGLMTQYQQKVQMGDSAGAMDVAKRMFPEEVLKSSLKEKSEQNPWSGITPSQYTNESLAAYQNSIAKGSPDRSVLVADPRQTREAGASNIEVKTGESFWKEFGKGQAGVVMKQQDTAQQAADSVTVLHNMRRQLDGGAITGFGADLVLNFGRALSFAGFKSAEDPVANTQAFAAQAGNLVGQIIKQFGSGTGLSDADREYATKIAGGQITMDEKALRRLLDINEKANRVLITRYNKKVRDMKKKAPSSEIPIELEIEEPQAYSGNTWEDGGYLYRKLPDGTVQRKKQ